MPTQANITVNSLENNPSVKAVNIAGELDESNLSEFETVVNPLINDVNNSILIFNLKGLEFISSKVIGQFAALYTTLSHAQRKLILTDLNQTITDIITLVGLNQMITIYPTFEEAVQAISAPASEQPPTT